MLFRWMIAATAMTAWALSLGQETSSDAPVLALSQAVQMALSNNRPVNIARLDIVKSKWAVAQNKNQAIPHDIDLPFSPQAT